MLVEEMVREVVQENNGRKEIEYCDDTGVKYGVSYKESFRRISFSEAFEIYVGDYNECTLPKMIEKFPKMFYEGNAYFYLVNESYRKIFCSKHS